MRGESQHRRGRHDLAGDGGWTGGTPFPFIQGADCCGRVAAVGADRVIESNEDLVGLVGENAVNVVID